MDASTQRLLNDKLYEKRKQGALELASLRSCRAGLQLTLYPLVWNEVSEKQAPVGSMIRSQKSLINSATTTHTQYTNHMRGMGG